MNLLKGGLGGVLAGNAPPPMSLFLGLCSWRIQNLHKGSFDVLPGGSRPGPAGKAGDKAGALDSEAPTSGSVSAYDAPFPRPGVSVTRE